MFGPRLGRALSAARTPTTPPVQVEVVPVGMTRSGGDLADARSVAPFDEWGHAHDAPADDTPPRRLGMPPFTV